MDNQDQPPPEELSSLPLSQEVEDNNNGNNKIPSFTGELTLQFPLTKEEEQSSGSTGLNIFTPQQLMRGSDKWSYPFPSIALSEDATMIDYVNHFGEDFVADIFLDGLRKFCQGKWKQATSEADKSLDFYVDEFKKNFFLIRRDTGPTASKVGLEITKLMKELGKLKQGTPERKLMVTKIKELKLEQDKLMEKEMEL
jgi:hypothetical protein